MGEQPEGGKADQERRQLHVVLQPEGWPMPKGYANGVLADGRLVFTGGMVGWDRDGRFAAGFLDQVRQALQNVRAVLVEAGAGPEHLVRLTWYVVGLDDYRADPKGLGAVYREVMGRNFPAMAVVEVSGLVEPQARVEIEATAVIPDRPGRAD